VKFLCDRCKTRYSIGDDRVRGKILKIRCKNCANVITVREGMSDVDADDLAERRHRPTTAAPKPSYTSTADNGSRSALGAAFASQMTKPPPALEEEWYVSIDGDQSGPFSLVEAQRWVGGKSFDADLHCWSEGFDDWLPVDKVSHFRGLRKKPMPAQAPPPLPRAGGAMRMQQAVEDEPKPLFAATMASLEKAASDPKIALPAITSTPTHKGPGVVAKTNGSAVSAPAAAPMIPSVAKPAMPRGTAPAVATPLAAKPAPTMPQADRSRPVPKLEPVSAKADVSKADASKPTASPSGPHRATTVPGLGASASPGAAALAQAFDASETDSSLTQVEAPAFADEVATRAEPIAAKRTIDRVDSVADAATTTPSGMAASTGVPPDFDEENLEIGEVSRVVKLADLAKMSTPKKSRPPIGRSTGSAPRIGGADLSATGQVALGDAPTALGGPMVNDFAGESVVVPPVVAQAHRRGMIMLLAFAGMLLAGVTGAVILLVMSNSDDDLPGGLGRASQIDTSRPEDQPGRRTPTDPLGTGSGTVPTKVPIRHWPVANPNIKTGSATEPEVTDPAMKKIDATEVEDYASKQNGGTQRCFMRAQKGVDGILIGDVRKLFVTLTIDKDGGVSDVQLSEHGADSLGKCLTSLIKRWKFRTSPTGGTFKFALAFAS
jgi:predicted Zn finger-like uncharacterized protein